MLLESAVGGIGSCVDDFELLLEELEDFPLWCEEL